MTELCCRCNLPKEAPKASSGSASFRYICRLCLMRSENTEPIFVHPGDKTLANKILACTGVEVDENAVIGPTNICMACKTTVYKSYQFWELCQRSNKIIQNLLAREEPRADNESASPSNSLRVVIRPGLSTSSTSQGSPAKRKRVLSVRRSALEESTSASDVSWSECDDENNDIDEDVDEVMPFRQLAYETDTQDDVSPKRRKLFADTSEDQMPLLEVPPAQINGSVNHQRQPSVSDDSEMPQVRSPPRASMPSVPDTSFDCEFCDASFPYRIQLNHHIGLCHGDRKEQLTCRICSKYYTRTAELRDHCAEKHPMNSADVECTLCQRTYANKYVLKQHYKSIMHRAASGEAVYPRRRGSNLRSPARCASTDTYMGYQSDTSPGRPGLWDEGSNPFEHVSYNQIQRYDCDYCDDRFDDRQGLADHTAVRPCRIELQPLNLDLLLEKIDLDEVLQPINSQSEVCIIEPTIEIVDLT